LELEMALNTYTAMRVETYLLSILLRFGIEELRHVFPFRSAKIRETAQESNIAQGLHAILLPSIFHPLGNEKTEGFVSLDVLSPSIPRNSELLNGTG
jgi:hypothetical protein